MPLSDEMGGKLVNILEQITREMLRSRLRNSEQTRREHKEAVKAKNEIEKSSDSAWTVSGFKSRAGAELMLKDLRQIDPETFKYASVQGHFLVHPKSKEVRELIKKISKDRSIVAAEMSGGNEEPYIKSVDEGDISKLIVGEGHSYNDAINAQYFASILEDNDIDVTVEKNAIVVPHADLKTAESVLENASARMEAMGPERAEAHMRQLFKDRLGLEFDSDMKIIGGDEKVKAAPVPQGERLAPPLPLFSDPAKEAAEQCLRKHGFETQHSNLPVTPDYSPAFAVNEKDLEAAKKVLEEHNFEIGPDDIAIDNSLKPRDARKAETVEKTGPEQTREIEEEELAEETAESPAVKPDGPAEKGEDADERLSRETRKAELHEDIANVKTTADCVQARPDANNQDISTPYADGQDAPGTGDIDADGIPDAAEDIDGDGTPDEWDGKAEVIDDDPDYEPVSMKDRDLDQLMLDKDNEAKFAESRETARGEKDVSLQTEAR